MKKIIQPCLTNTLKTQHKPGITVKAIATLYKKTTPTDDDKKRVLVLSGGAEGRLHTTSKAPKLC